MKVRVLVVGADAKDPLQQAAADYLARAGRRFDAGIVPVVPARRGKGADDDRVKRDEAAALLAASENTTRVALDPTGKLHATSHALAEGLEKLLARGKPVSFLIGGASGLHDDARAAADAVWSLSPLTFAHRLALVVVAEQIYRAAEIARGGPYAR